MTTGRTVNGNRLALVGAILYLLEFAFIIPSGVRVPAEGSGPAEIAAAYAAQPPSGMALLFAGLCVALLGRIAFSAGVRSVLRQTNETRALADFALGAMVVSVVLELAGEVVRITATRLAVDGADPTVWRRSTTSGAAFSSQLGHPSACPSWPRRSACFCRASYRAGSAC